MATKRFGRVLRLREGVYEEYRKHHQAVWPEVLEDIRRAGITEYTIFHYDGWLFSYFELAEGKTLDDVAEVVCNSPRSQEWEAFMHTLQEPLPESGDEVWWVPMEEVFRYPPDE